MRWHTNPRDCSHSNDDACPTGDFDGYYRARVMPDDPHPTTPKEQDHA